MSENLKFLIKKHRFYISCFFSFLFWITFLDEDNMINRYKIVSQISHFCKEIEFYKLEIKFILEEKNKLEGSIKEVEKFAREKYFMKKKNEDLYIIQK